MWVFLMKQHSELFATFQDLCAEIKTQFGATICTLRSDNALDYFHRLSLILWLPKARYMNPHVLEPYNKTA